MDQCSTDKLGNISVFLPFRSFLFSHYTTEQFLFLLFFILRDLCHIFHLDFRFFTIIVNHWDASWLKGWWRLIYVDKAGWFVLQYETIIRVFVLRDLCHIIILDFSLFMKIVNHWDAFWLKGWWRLIYIDKAGWFVLEYKITIRVFISRFTSSLREALRIVMSPKYFWEPRVICVPFRLSLKAIISVFKVET